MTARQVLFFKILNHSFFSNIYFLLNNHKTWWRERSTFLLCHFQAYPCKSYALQYICGKYCYSLLRLMQIPHAKLFETLILLKWFHSFSFEHFTFRMLILDWLTWLYVYFISLGMILFISMLFVYDNGCIFREPCLGMKSRERINSWNCQQVII